MLLSKTNYLIYRDCKKNAWLKIHKSEIYKQYPLNSFELGIIETGNEIDELARELFPNGVVVEDRNGSELTKELIEKKTLVIYQAVFKDDKYITACDILVYNEKVDKYDLYEVKSSTASEDKGGRKTKDYIIDIAFQLNVIDIPI
ncbi:MAG: hypothetical protein U9R00_02510, partial [Patescibacteria group bacterium]|nr:hypothetical protein [Patescibacteria group bacterium]